MADLTRTIEIVFGAVDQGVASTTKAIDSALGSLETRIPNVAAPLAKIADAALAAETAIIALATAYGVTAIRASSEFETAQVTLKKVLDDNPESLSKLTDLADQLAVTYGKSATSILNFSTEFIQAGFNADEAGTLTKNALDLMIAGEVDAGQATDTLIRIIRGFGLSVDQVAPALDALNAVVDKTAVNLPKLSEALGIAAPVAAKLGFSLNETTAILTPIIEQFQSGSEAGTAFSTALGRLIDDSKPVVDNLRKLGIEQKTTTGEFKTGRDIFFEVAAAFKNLDDTQRLFYANQLVGVEQGKRLVNAFSDLNRVTEILNITSSSQGSIAREVELRLATLDQRVASVSAAFELLNRAVGANIAESFGGTAEAALAVVQAFTKVVQSGDLSPLFNAISANVDKINAVLLSVARNLPEALRGVDFSPLIRSFENVGESLGNALSAAFGRVDLSTPEGLREAIQRIVDGIAALQNVVAGIIQGLRPVFAAFGEIASRTSDAGEEAQLTAGKFLAAAKLINEFGTALALFATALNESKSDIQSVGDVLQGSLVAGINLLQTAFDAAAGAIVTALAIIARAIEALTPDALGDPFVKIASDLELLQNAIGQNFNRNLSELGGGLKQIGEGLGIVDREAKPAADSLNKVGQAGADAVKQTKGFEPINLGDIDFVAEAAKRLGVSLKDANEANKTLRASQGETAAEWATAGERAQGYKKVVDELGNVTYVQVGGAIARTTNALAQQKNAMEDATQASESFRLKLAEITAKQNIAVIEAKVKIDTAQIASDTERVKSAFNSINVGIESTGKTLSSLTSEFADVLKSDPFNASKVGDLVKAEEKRRQDEFDLQKRLVDEQIRYLRARTEKLFRSDPLIKVEAQNLKPALEMIFVEILKYTQVRANQEGLELLLGVV